MRALPLLLLCSCGPGVIVWDWTDQDLDMAAIDASVLEVWGKGGLDENVQIHFDERFEAWQTPCGALDVNPRFADYEGCYEGNGRKGVIWVAMGNRECVPGSGLVHELWHHRDRRERGAREFNKNKHPREFLDAVAVTKKKLVDKWCPVVDAGE